MHTQLLEGSFEDDKGSLIEALRKVHFLDGKRIQSMLSETGGRGWVYAQAKRGALSRWYSAILSYTIGSRPYPKLTCQDAVLLLLR